MDFMKAMNVAQNPQGYVNKRMLDSMIQQHPEEWKAAQGMFSPDMSRKQKVSKLRKLFESKGMDLGQMAAQYGIAL